VTDARRGGHSMRLDCLEVLEAAYAPSPTDEAWLANLLAPFEPMTLGAGVMARMFRVDPAGG
jgi:hypothetical protein